MESRRLQRVEDLAVRVAVEGLALDPAEPVPVRLRPILRFRKFTAAARATVREVLESDDEFRARVVAVADEEDLGRYGWLWLTRPDGWEQELQAVPSDAASNGDLASLERRLRGAEAAVERVRSERDAEREAAGRLRRRVASAEHDLAEARAERDELRALADAAAEERSRVLRALKAAESERDAARHDLRDARRANVDAEAELAALKEATATGGGEVAPAPPTSTRVTEALGRARRALSNLDEALASAEAEIGLGDRTRAGRGRGAGRAGGDKRPVKPTRRRRTLRIGLRDGTVEALRHLLGIEGAVLLVDGYNLARLTWPNLAPDEERRRTVALLEEVQNRYGCRVVVVFDGESGTVAPPASRWVTVRFSPTGTTADDVIIDMVGRGDGSMGGDPVVVVSSDMEIVRAAERSGAHVFPSAVFVAARP